MRLPKQTLRPEVQARPNDASALTLLGVALDGQKKFAEAEAVHHRAVANAPNSPDAWNNYANHLMEAGDQAGASRLYLRVVALDVSNYNANVQLARLSVGAKNGAEALSYFQHLPASQQDAPRLAPLRVAALYLAGETAQADALAARWLAVTKSDLPRASLSAWRWPTPGRFAKAGAFFTPSVGTRTLQFQPAVQFGRHGLRSGNFKRAREVLEAAGRQQPENVNVLYNLACVEHAANRNESAVALLAKAALLAPQRADVQKLLAMSTGDLGALDDAAAAWDQYLKLVPDDDVARRERGFVAFQKGLFEQGLTEVQGFVARHPDDPVGHYELGAIQNKDNPAQALTEYDRAVALNPAFAAAHSERGSLHYQMGKPESAFADLEAAVALRPDDAVSLDRLGQTYLALDRTADALRVLSQAATLAPDDSKTQLHLARALADNGQAAESKAAMDRFRRLGPVVNRAVPGGLVDYLSLTPDQRRADYRRRVERLVREHPDDAQDETGLLELLLEDGQWPQAAETAHTIAALKPSATVLANAGRALLEARQYVPAQELLRKAAAVPRRRPNCNWIWPWRCSMYRVLRKGCGNSTAFRIPDAPGSSTLARAEMLDAAGNASQAAAALDQALRNSPGQAAPYLQACIFLLGKSRPDDVLRVSDEAIKTMPQDRQILLLRAVALEEAGRTEEARRVLEQIQNRWPEWAAAWAVDGIVLAAHGQRQEAIAALRTAVALGANNMEVKRYLEEVSAGSPDRPPAWSWYCRPRSAACNFVENHKISKNAVYSAAS